MKNKSLLTLVICIGFVGMGNQGCEQQPSNRPPDQLVVTPAIMPDPKNTDNFEEFTITTKGYFNAGYDNAKREIFIIKNNTTGEEYLGITDCTLIKRINDKEDDSSISITPTSTFE